MKRQAWQDFRLRFVISHSLVAGQLYSMFPVSRHRQGCQVPCGAPTHRPETGWGLTGQTYPAHHTEGPTGQWFSK